MWLFNNGVHQKEIHSMLIYGNKNGKGISTQ